VLAGRVVQVELEPELARVLAELGTARVLGQELELAIDLAGAQARVIVRGAELELAIAQVVGRELAIARVLGRELPTAQVVGQELERVPVAAVELERDPVVALALDQVVVALRIRLVTAARHRDLVLLLAAEEDLEAAAAETTREPAAAEAVIAWEVAE
jgi:hypothetical protein